MQSTPFDDTPCTLGEGPLWHPQRGELLWFDIIGKRLYAKAGASRWHYQFDEMASAAGWIDETNLLVATETAFTLFNLATHSSEVLCGLEADNPLTRSNDGRADPWGGFWIGTMGKNAEPDGGAIYRYYRGEVRQLYAPISISNAICFDPDGQVACFTDTRSGKVMRQKLSQTHGWPVGDPDVYLDFSKESWGPDGAVFDASGLFWNAQWGASRIGCYDQTGSLVKSIGFPAPHTSCPAFGGDDLTTLYCTTARQGLDPAALAEHPQSGMTFCLEGAGRGQAEHQVVL